MENIWTKINDDLPLYMKYICDKYELVCTKISPLKTALIGKGFALIIAIDRFDAKVIYFYKENNEEKVFLCDNYFAEKYDSNDRINLLEEGECENIIRNNLIIIANGLMNKWENVLKGQTDWIDKYKKSKWFAVERLLPEEVKRIEILL
ncbi:MAG: hypothetical protein IJN92_02060 [Lachnospiraceae bacterium]|nr:hypothetical protein [Lachnospiraceae bacterium]